KENPRRRATRVKRGRDLNPRPPGYKPDELPDCSTPRRWQNRKLIPTEGDVNPARRSFSAPRTRINIVKFALDGSVPEVGKRHRRTRFCGACGGRIAARNASPIAVPVPLGDVLLHLAELPLD